MTYNIDTATAFFKFLANARFYCDFAPRLADLLNEAGYPQPDEYSDIWDGASVVLLLQSLRFPQLLSNPLSDLFPNLSLTQQERQILLCASDYELGAVRTVEGYIFQSPNAYH